MTTACIAALRFRGNHESARTMLKQYGYIPNMLSKSRFSRRLHRLQGIFVLLFNLLGQIWKTLNTDAVYVIDSLPGIRLTRDSWNTNAMTQKRPKCPPMEGRGFRGLKPLWYNGVPP